MLTTHLSNSLRPRSKLNKLNIREGLCRLRFYLKKNAHVQGAGAGTLTSGTGAGVTQDRGGEAQGSVQGHPRDKQTQLKT